MATPPQRSSTRQSKQPERFKDGALSWQQVSEMFPEMDEEELVESDFSGDGSDYDAEAAEDDVDFDADSDQGEEFRGIIDPTLMDGFVEEDAEEDIQDDFRALVDEMNHADVAGRGSKRSDFTMTEADMDLRQNLRAAARIGRPKGGRRRRRGQAQYSDEVRTLLSDAQNAFVEQRSEEAIRLAREAVRIEPRAAEGWSVLAGVYAEMGDADAALKFRIMKAHMSADAEVWKQLATESLEMELPRQALYCYRKVLQIDRNDPDAIWDRAFLLKGMSEFEQSLKGFTGLLELHPHNPNVLQQIYHLCIEMNDLPRALQLYQGAFDYHSKFPPNEELFGIPSLVILADLHIATGNLDGAIQTIKAGTRWLQNRSNETFWDLVEDDREYDPQGYVREALEGQEEDRPPGFHPLPFELRHRLAMTRLKTGNDLEAQIHVDVIRGLDRGLHPEYFEYMMEIGDTFFERGLWEEAYQAYDDVHGASEVVSRHLLSQIGRCLRNLGRIDDAIRVLEQVIEVAPDSVDAKLDLVELLEASGQLEKAYELVLQIKDARRREELRSPDAGSDVQEGQGEVFKEIQLTQSAKRPPTQQEKMALEAQRTEVALVIYERLKTFEEAAEAGDPIALEEWMFQARRLIDIFRSTRMVFPSDRHKKYTGFFGRLPWTKQRGERKTTDIDRDVADITSRLQESMEDDTGPQAFVQYSTNFRGILFDDWLLLFLTYCFRLVRRGELGEADNILRHISYSVVFQPPRYQDVLAIALIACAIFSGDWKTLKEQTRKTMFQHQFNNDALRLLVAALGSGLDSYIIFTEPKLGKFYMREIKIATAAVAGEKLNFHRLRQRWAIPNKPGTVPDKDDMEFEDASSDDEREESQTLSAATYNVNRRQQGKDIPLPTKENPVLYAVYGHMLMAVKSYQSALFYLMHAYELNPYDPLLCISIAVSYVGRSMQRQSDNRHHQIVQGLAFLSRYRNLRSSDNEYGEEIEYNFGRYFHQIGVLHLAVKHYQRVLDIARGRRQAGQPIPSHAPVKEAAYNLSLIYATSGAADLAHVLYQEWLTL